MHDGILYQPKYFFLRMFPPRGNEESKEKEKIESIESIKSLFHWSKKY